MKKRLPIIFVGFFIVLNLIIWWAVFKEDRSGVMTVSFLDIGQGDAIFIEAPNGNQFLIDAGPGNSVTRVLGVAMPFYDRSIDVLLMTHPDADHIGGFVEILRRYKVAAVFESGVLGDTALYASIKSEVANEALQSLLGKSGDRIILDKKHGVYFEVLFPDRDVRGLETNTGSLVGKLVYGDTCFILTGDSPVAIEEYLVRVSGEDMDCEVLKAGHHGSNTSSSPIFVAMVSPEYAVISAGKDNRYGHPHATVLEIFENIGAEILRTDTMGTIVFETDGTALRLK